jgi:hypothetical protein
MPDFLYNTSVTVDISRNVQNLVTVTTRLPLLYNVRMSGVIPDSIAPCGVYCGACPSFERSCLGCRSENREQKRSSKWGCRIRQCCFGKGLDFCNQCEDYPCKPWLRKLPDSHPGDARFAYRHEVGDNLQRLKEMGVDGWLEEQKRKWQCPRCGGVVRFYHYRCSDCGYQVGS